MKLGPTFVLCTSEVYHRSIVYCVMFKSASSHILIVDAAQYLTRLCERHSALKGTICFSSLRFGEPTTLRNTVLQHRLYDSLDFFWIDQFEPDNAV